MAAKGNFDVIVIGAGIAGAGVAAELAADARVLLLEMEAQPGYHSTGRSAAVFSKVYGPAPIRALTRASEGDFRNPAPTFGESSLLKDNLALLIARTDQRQLLDSAFDSLRGEGSLELVDASEACRLMPLLREDYVAGAIVDSGFSDIDVEQLHQGYLRFFRSNGGNLQVREEVIRIDYFDNHWSVTTRSGQYRTEIVVNAAGAWAEQVGALAGAEAIGLQPRRRTCMLVADPLGISDRKLPLAADIEDAFYVKGELGKLLLCPGNEDLDVPSDVQPDEMDIAVCIDRVEKAFKINVRRIEHSWAGLRSFVPDKSPVVGFSDRVDGFFWLAGQGGYGIQTAPALSRFAASAILKTPVPHELVQAGFSPAMVAVNRLQSYQSDA